MPIALALRPVSHADRDFIFRLFATNTAMQMGALSWEETQRDPLVEMQFRAQEQFHRTQLPDADHQLVVYGDRPVGRMIVIRTEESIHLADIALLPEYQRQGIGTELMRRLQEEAKAQSLPITAHVFMMSPAVHFYQKLGFTISPAAPPQYLAEWKP